MLRRAVIRHPACMSTGSLSSSFSMVWNCMSISTFELGLVFGEESARLLEFAVEGAELLGVHVWMVGALGEQLDAGGHFLDAFFGCAGDGATQGFVGSH